jgi:hypothetical protein
MTTKPFLVPGVADLMRGLIYSLREYLGRVEAEKPTPEEMLGALQYIISGYADELQKIRARQGSYRPGVADLETRGS